MNRPCHRRLLATSEHRDGTYRIELCTCGHTHLYIGPLTVRLCPSKLAELGAVIDKAMQRLYKHREPLPPQRHGDSLSN